MSLVEAIRYLAIALLQQDVVGKWGVPAGLLGVTAVLVFATQMILKRQDELAKKVDEIFQQLRTFGERVARLEALIEKRGP